MSKKKAQSLTVWITREIKNATSRREAEDCNYEIWVGIKPVRDELFWDDPEGCEYVADLCAKLGPKYLRKVGISLRPGGGPLECVLTVKA